MKKIPSLFQRNYETDRLVRDEVVPGCEWVLAGEGVATRKWDGTCCMIRKGYLYKRYDAKHGKTPPEGFEPAQEADPVTGHWPGWLKVELSKNEFGLLAAADKADRWIVEAFSNTFPDYETVEPIHGTYEAVGPRINGGKDGLPFHCLIKHGSNVWPDFPRCFVDIKERLRDTPTEGIVFHHPDGRMCKVKRRDFGFDWPVKNRDK